MTVPADTRRRTGVLAPALACGMVLIVFLVSLWLRSDSFHGRTGAEDLEASYHVLWTMHALDETPVGAHLLLPTVTLDPDPEHPIRWGSTFPTRAGSYIYSSFPPLGFLIPHWALDWRTAPASLAALADFNALLGLVAAIGLGLLCRSASLMVAGTGATNRPSAAMGWGIAAFSASTYLLLRESLQSHGLVYWPHSPSQVVFVFASWLAVRRLAGTAQPWETLPLLILCLLFPMLEWTGYVFNVGLALAIALDGMRSRPATGIRGFVGSAFSAMPLALAGVTALAGLIMLGHLIWATGLGETVHILLNRASARSALADVTVIDLLAGYWESAGLLLPLAVAASGTIAVLRPPREALRLLGLIMLVVTFPLLENLVMLQHAIWFSFDRMKLAVPLLVLLTSALALMPVRLAVPLAACLFALTAGSNIAHFRALERPYDAWPAITAANDALIAEARTAANGSCRIWGSTDMVRGYLNLAVDADIYERMTPEKLQARAEGRSCDLLLLDTRTAYRDLHQVQSITLWPAAGPSDPITFTPTDDAGPS